MPYNEQGQRVTQEEYIRAKREREGRDPDGDRLFTGPNGENPAPSGDGPSADEAPAEQPKKPGTQRSKRSKKSVDAAIADALGTAVADLPEEETE